MGGKAIAAVMLCSFALGASIQNDIWVAPQDDRVTVELYYEALCPFCHKFMTEQLMPVLEKPGIWQIADFKFYAYGNAKTTKRGKFYSFKCQHGEEECQGNIIDTCALNLFNQQSVGIPFALCMSNSEQNWDTDGPKCAEEAKADWGQIKNCTNSFYGREWQFESGLKTDYVGANHVPYVLIDGVFDRQNEEYVLTDLLGTICRVYSGSRPKSYCSKYL